MSRLGALKMIKCRARKAALPAEICAHSSFHGTGITEYLRNGDILERERVIEAIQAHYGVTLRKVGQRPKWRRDETRINCVCTHESGSSPESHLGPLRYVKGRHA